MADNTYNTSSSGIWHPPYVDEHGIYHEGWMEWHGPPYPTTTPVWPCFYPVNPTPVYPNPFTQTYVPDNDTNYVMVKFKKLNESATAPTYGTAEAAGLDFYAVEDKVLLAGHTTKVPTGLAIELPVGTVGLMRGRSSLFSKKGLIVDGTVDSDYRGEVFVMIFNPNSYDVLVNKGDKIAQMVIAPFRKGLVFEAQELSDTVRGSGGFGSTDR